MVKVIKKTVEKNKKNKEKKVSKVVEKNVVKEKENKKKKIEKIIKKENVNVKNISVTKNNDEKKYVSRLKKKYKEKIIPYFMKKFNFKSNMAVPRLKKIVVNIGVGNATADSKLIEKSAKELSLITGQKPIITLAKKSIASFKLRKGQKIGCKVTLRDMRMYDFFDKLISIALPRVRDFRGISAKSFDGKGNYTLGIKEQLIFPEINYDDVLKIRGMDITIVTTAKNDEQAKELLSEFGMPFHK